MVGEVNTITGVLKKLITSIMITITMDIVSILVKSKDCDKNLKVKIWFVFA
jgi:hypothetical protein